MADDFNFFLPITKVDKERRQVSGYASTPARDLDGEVITLDAVKAALPGYMQWRNIRRMHTNDAIGIAKEANMDDKGLFLTAKIVDDDAWNKCMEGVYKGFSIGGRKLQKSGDTITEIELVEISVVDRPANPECKFEVQKRASTDADAFLVPMKPAKSAQTKALGFMAKAVQTLAKDGPPAAHDGFSLPAKPTVFLEKDLSEKRETKCEAHGKLDCQECAMAKREFNAKQRETAAESGAAEPDGSFPIKNKSDLKNAIRAYGRASNPAKTKAHIISRARALGLTDMVPEKWTKKLAKKEAKAAKKEFEAKTAKAATYTGPDDIYFNLTNSATLPFLSLSADNGAHAVEGQEGSGHEPFLKLGKGNTSARVEKRMSSAGTMSFCFDQLRDVQRSLIVESKQEGGDGKDASLAKQVGEIAAKLAEVIGQKADHEAGEALTLTDADDLWVNSLMENSAMDKGAKAMNEPLAKMLLDILKAGSGENPVARARAGLKKARKEADNMEECIKAAHAMHKNAYLAKAALVKAGKAKDSDDDFDHRDAMEKLQKAFNSLSTMKSLMKAAGTDMKKVARAGQRGQETADGNSFYMVPPGVKDLDPDHMATLSPGGDGSGSMPPELMLDGPAQKMAKNGTLSVDTVNALIRATRAEAQVEVLSKLPANPSGRPATFDAARLRDGSYGIEKSVKGLPASIFKDVDVSRIGCGDEELHKAAAGKAIGNFLLGGHGRDILTDASFRGTAGAGNAVN